MNLLILSIFSQRKMLDKKEDKMTLYMDEDTRVCCLELEDGTVLPGKSFGAPIDVDGEVGKCYE